MVADTVYRKTRAEWRVEEWGRIIMTFILNVFSLVELLDTQVSGNQLNL